MNTKTEIGRILDQSIGERRRVTEAENKALGALKKLEAFQTIRKRCEEKLKFSPELALQDAESACSKEGISWALRPTRHSEENIENALRRTEMQLERQAAILLHNIMGAPKILAAGKFKDATILVVKLLDGTRQGFIKKDANSRLAPFDGYAPAITPKGECISIADVSAYRTKNEETDGYGDLKTIAERLEIPERNVRSIESPSAANLLISNDPNHPAQKNERDRAIVQKAVDKQPPNHTLWKKILGAETQAKIGAELRNLAQTTLRLAEQFRWLASRRLSAQHPHQSKKELKAQLEKETRMFSKEIKGKTQEMH